MRKEKNELGFTITELLLIITIVILIGTGVVLVFGGQIRKSRIAEFRKQMQDTSHYISGCLRDNGMLLDSGNYDIMSEDGGEICSSSGHGKYSAPKERVDCDGSGIYSIFATATFDGIESACNLNNKGEKCIAVCTADGCSFTGECD